MRSYVPLAADRIRRTLGGEDLAWLVERLSRRIQQGRPLTGTVSLSRPTPGQRRAVEGLLGRPPGRGSALTVRLEELDEELQDAELAPDLRAAVEVLTGPLRDLADERASEQRRKDACLDALRSGSHAGTDWYENWVEALTADGTLTRLARRGDHHLAGQAAAVLGRLPADGLLPLPVLAERAVGDTKALSGTPLARLVLRALAARAGRATPPRGRIAEREVWESAGVVVDDLASQVLVLGVTAREDHIIADWLRDASEFGIPFRLTLHQLTADPVTVKTPELYVCENPAVLRTVASELGGDSAPLVCTEGIASAACLRLLEAAARAGTRLHWRGDFDWTGVRTTADALTRFGASPWRMSADDYLTALAAGDAEPLRGTPAPTPWDPVLADHLTASGQAVMEERLLPALLEDLERGPSRS